MAIDLAKLSPAPWKWSRSWADKDLHWCVDHPTETKSAIWPLVLVATDPSHADNADMQFITLARQAFDVLMRRGWWPAQRPDNQWIVTERDGQCHTRGSEGWADPFTALVEADAWYAANVESKAEQTP